METQELEELRAKASEGPWHGNRKNWPDGSSSMHINSMAWSDLAQVWLRGIDANKDDPEGIANATLIAAAPDLAAEVLRLRAEVAQLVAANQALVVDAARMREAVDPDFILDAMDSVHDMDVTLADYAKAVSRAIRRELEGKA